MTKHVYGADLCNPDGSANNQAWEEYLEFEGKSPQDALFRSSFKNREDFPIADYLWGYFPDAFLAEVEVAVSGNRQHNPGEKNIRWAREKSTDHLNKAFRHMWDDAMGNDFDEDNTWHLAKAIWRLRARLQLKIEQKRRDDLWHSAKAL